MLTKDEKRKVKKEQRRKERGLGGRSAMQAQQNLSRLEDLIAFDREQMQADDFDLVIGVDEVGRGCMAGPVCTAAYALDLKSELFGSEFSALINFQAHSLEPLDEEVDEVTQTIETLALLNDSKKVAKSRRDELCNSLRNVDGSLMNIDFRTAQEIDETSIIACIWKSMRENFLGILEGRFEEAKVLLLVDGPKVIQDLSSRGAKGDEALSITQIPVVRGDSQSFCIAAASNLAKQARDRYMQEQALKYPGYGWDTNVGYGTAEHLAAMQKQGLNYEHRRSFSWK